MFNFIKNKFAFIVALSLLILVFLIVGSVVLYKDESKSFSGEGYIISSTQKKNAKYYFNNNTKYKENVDSDIVFKDKDSKSRTISSQNFVHYLDGSMAFLTNGALVNLNEINSSALNYYNITNDNLISYKNNSYSIKSNKGTMDIESFLGRISDNKYIVAGKDLVLKLPNNDDKIIGDYFEVLFIENGIVKIDNQEASYQVTAQGSTISVGENLVIDLGTEKISYNGEAKMLMSQLTINGDENINLDVDKKESSDGSGNGNEDSTEKEGDNQKENQNDQNNEQQNNDKKTEENSDNKEKEGDENGKGGNGNGGAPIDNTAQIELIEAKSSSTSLRLSFQLNNASALSGKLMATLKNIGNGRTEYEKEIPAKNGTFSINKESLSPNSEYTLTITEKTNKSEKQYFQKTFRTNDLGITLEKEYATSSSLSYNLNFDENSEVTRARIVIYDNSGSNETIEPNSFIVNASDISKNIEFTGLKSNSNYSVSVDSVWINNVAYSDVYTINRIDTTLKQKPILSDIKITANTDEVKFNIKVNKIEDPDGGIVSYLYKVYKASDITLDNPNPEPVYTLTRNDAEEIVLNLAEIPELKTGVDYRCKVVAQYDDNNMIRESESDYSKNFLIRSRPNVEWSAPKDSITMNSAVVEMKLIDVNCSVPMSGRACANKSNNIKIKYYPVGTSENDAKELSVKGNGLRIDPTTLTSTINLTGLKSNTTYAIKLYGDCYDDDDKLNENQLIGDVFYVKTDMSVNLKFVVTSDNESGTPNENDVVTFNAKLEAPSIEEDTYKEEISKIKFKLYSGSYNKEEKLIGTYDMDDKSTIRSFFNNFNITNQLFREIKEENPKSITKILLKQLSNNSGLLNGTYTVEVAEVLDSSGVNNFYVEDNVYTFKLTPKYYLDERIASLHNYDYILVDQIKKEDLLEDEYTELSKTIHNLDDLNEDTVVGINIENRLSDAFVDSAFKYEKVIVDYVVKNTVTNKEVKRISIDMGNKYQPKSKTIYLDPTDDDSIEDPFIRGYKYEVSYELKFITEDGSNPIYTNEKLKKLEEIKRQSPIYTQYISKSTSDSITYRYSITDLDEALQDKYLYYSYKDDQNQKIKSENEMETDGDYHDITFSLSDKKEYSIFLNEKGTIGTNVYTEINKNEFESEYNYDNETSYSLVKDETKSDNLLKIKILDNDVTNRAAGYKVTIKANGIKDYVRYFLASQLYTEEISTGTQDEEGNDIKTTEKYIAIDYASIYEYMGKDLTVSVESYYDSGLTGYNQTFTNGLILKKYIFEKDKTTKKYLNIYNNTSSENTENKEETVLNGIYKFKENYTPEKDSISIYNYLQGTKSYNKFIGTSYYTSSQISEKIGINYNLTYTNNGIIFKNKKEEYNGYNAKVIKTASLNTNDNTYRFNNITPKVSLDSSNNTINSLNLKVNSTGIYGQFIKNNQEHNVFYIDIYSDEEKTNKITTTPLTSNITIANNVATSEEVKLENLKPDTKYYVTISAYINNKLTQLYDVDSSNGYVTKTYETSTLNANTLLEKIIFKVDKPKSYNADGSSNKDLTWYISLKNLENYKLRFELKDKEGNQVRFNGSPANNCDNTISGTEENSYISNCYIQVDKEDINKINKQNIVYEFSGNDFVYGSGYYQLRIYAIPYTNNKYEENDKLLIYENESLKNVEAVDELVPGTTIRHKITLPNLESATITLNEFVSGARCLTEKDENGDPKRDSDGKVICDNDDVDEYYIEFKPTVIDTSKVIKYGKYNIYLKDLSNNVIDSKTNINVDSEGKIYSFVGLNRDSTYNVEISYVEFMNDNRLEEIKDQTKIKNNYILTPITRGVSLGEISATADGKKKIILNYNKYNLLDKITEVSYTIRQKSGVSEISGSYRIGTDKDNVFNVNNISSNTMSLIIDFSEVEDFSLEKGNSYIINTQYKYIDDDNIEKDLINQNNNTTTFTTTLDY